VTAERGSTAGVGASNIIRTSRVSVYLQGLPNRSRGCPPGRRMRNIPPAVGWTAPQGKPAQRPSFL